MKNFFKKYPKSIIFINILIIMVVVVYLIVIDLSIKKDSFIDEKQKFESVTSIVKHEINNYIETSSGILKDWCQLINRNQWTMDEVIENISNLNSNPDAMIQIICSDCMEGISYNEENPDSEGINYKNFPDISEELNNFKNTCSENDVFITDPFPNFIDSTESIAFVSVVNILDDNGESKTAFLMRVDSVETMNKLSIINDIYPLCKISLINKYGDYIFHSSEMGNSNFYDFLKFCNNISDDELEEIKNSINSSEKSGSYIFKNLLGNQTVYAYSTSGYNDWIVIASAETNIFYSSKADWTMINVIIVTFTFLLIFNMIYYFSITKQLNSSLEEVKKANQVKTRFLSSMSHDIRTPVNAITGFTEIAMNNIDQKNNVRECLKKISLASQHLLTLINDILDISQIEGGKFPIKSSVFSLEESADDLVNILYQQAFDKNINCEVQLEGIVQEYLYADKLRLNQIWINILSNAIKYTSEGGNIKIFFKEENIPENPSKVRLIFRVSDNGIGMSPEFLKIIFNPFEREKDCRIDKVQGTGLGMAITKQIVDMLGGTIDVESIVGKGSVFTVTLDIERAEVDTSEKRLNNISALLIGNESTNKSTKEMLINLGAYADCAEDTKMALSFISDTKKHYDVVIIDRIMNSESCLETSQAIRQSLGNESPYIIVSAYSVNDIEEKAKRFGVDAFISKPVFLTPLYEEILKLMKGSVVESDVNESDNFNDFSGICLLVAEDNELNWEIVNELLGMYNIVAERAVNGFECVKMLEKSSDDKYAMIFMDIQMPVMNGYEATKMIRKLNDNKKANIPIVAMTADAFASDISSCMEAGMNGHISKPVDLNIMINEIKKYI